MKQESKKEGLEQLQFAAERWQEEEEQEVKRWTFNGDPSQYGDDFGPWTRQMVADQ